MKKILVVDDNEQNLYMLEVLLSGHGYEVVTASNGEEALEKARNTPPEIIIADILMPVMDGFTLCRKWKKDPELNSIPFIFYTATYTDPKDEEFALSLGADRFIVKPEEPDVFLKIVQETIKEFGKGKGTSPLRLDEDEKVVLKEYNERLVEKLEDQLFQLEEEIKLRIQTQAALEESQKNLVDAQRIAHIGSWFWDTRTGKVEWTEEVYRIFDLERETFQPEVDSIMSRFYPEDSDLDEKLIAHLTASHDPYSFEARILLPDGNIRYLIATSEGQYDDGRDLISITGTVQDITKRKQAEQELREEAHRNEQILNTMLDGFILADTEGQLISANPAYCALVGYSEAELLQMNIRELEVKLSPEEVERRIKQMVNQGLDRFETQHQHKDGHVIELDVSIVIMQTNSAPLVAAFVHDISERVRSEEALKASEEKFRTISEGSLQGIVITQGQVIQYANLAFEEIYGYTMAELNALTDQERIERTHPEDSERVTKYHIDFFEGKDVPKNIEYRIIRKDGETRWVDSRTTLIDFQDEQAFLSSIIDITERKQAEVALEEKTKEAQLLAKMLDSSSQPFVVGTPDGRLSKVNPAYCKLTGYSEKELYDTVTWNETLTPEEWRAYESEKLQKVLETGEPQLFEKEYIRKDGSRIPVELLMHRSLDADNNIENVFGFITDISERKQAEETMRLQSAALQAAANAIVITDEDGTISWVNQGFTNFTGYSLEEVIGKNPRILKSGYQDEEFYKDLWETILSGKVWQGEMLNKRKDGSLYTEEDIITPLKNTEGKITHFIAIKQDITDRKEAEKEILNNHNQLESIFRAAPTGIGMVIDRKIQFVNDRFAEMLGYTEKELVGEFSRIVYPSDVEFERVGKYKYEEIKEKGTGSIETILQKKDGSLIDVLLSSTPLDLQDLSQGVTFTALDITERKQTETKLLESEQNLKVLIDNSVDVIWKMDLKLNFTYVNPSVYNIAGYTQEEWIGSNLSQHTTRKEFLKLSRKALGAIKNYKTFKYVIFETVFLKKNGEEFPAEIISKVLLNEKGIPIGLQGSTRDITARKEAEKKLKNSLDELAHNQEVLLALSKAAEEVQQSKSPEQVLQTISEQISNLGYHNTTFFISDDETHLELAHISYDSKLIQAVEKLMGVSAQGYRYSIGEDNFFSDVLANAKAMIDESSTKAIEHALPKPMVPLASQLTKILGIEKAIYVPLVIDDKPIGMLIVIGSDLTAADLPAMTTFGNQVAIALENTRLYREANQRLARLSSLRNIDQAITGSFDLKVTLDILLGQLLTQLKIDAAAVLRYEKASQTLVFSHGRGFQTTAFQHTKLRLGKGNAGKAALQREDVFIPDLTQPEAGIPNSPEFKEEGFRAYYGIPLIAKGTLIGVLEIFQRSPLNPDEEWVDYLQTLAGQAAIAIDNITLFDDLQFSNVRLVQAYDATIKGWSQVLELRDMETVGHSRRVVEITMDIAQRLGISDEEFAQIRRGALLHDIGKMGVPDAILQKPGPLTDEEWVIMRQHPLHAYEWLSSIEYLRPALDIPYCHHERWDGTGYPRGLKGEQIPLAARIFAIVDVWDALLSDRPYRKAWSKEKTLTHIQAESGKHFDPRVTDVFLEYIRSQ